MKRPHTGAARNAVIRVAVFALLGGLLGTTACASDTSGPESRVDFLPVVPSHVIQDENLVPNYDYSNPGFLEPYGTLSQSLDEDTPNDDTDYIWRYRSGQPPTNSAAEVDLTDPVGDTPSPTQTHTLKVRWKVVGDYSTSTPQPTLLNFKLVDNQNGVIASGTSIPTGNDYITASTGVNVGQISDYRALRIYLNVQLKPLYTSNQIQARITWARLEIR